MDIAALVSRSLARRTWLFGRAILFSTFLFILLLGINALQTISLLCKIFSQPLFRKINQHLAHFYGTILVLLMDKIYRVRIIWQCDILPEREDAIVIANHQTAVDIMPLFALAHRSQRVGDMKFFVKEVFKYIPGPGWGLIFLDSIFLKRRWMADRRRIKQSFQKFIREGIPLWLNIFPEGTRFTHKKMLDAQSTARHYKLPICEHVLVPFAKAFETSVLGLKDHVQAVYDVTIGYPDGIPTLWQLMLGDVPCIEVRVERFLLESLPNQGLAIEQWLNDRFWAKELILRHLRKHGSFPALHLPFAVNSI